jgi:acyl carrier protein
MTRSPEISQAIFEDVKAIVVATLEIEDQVDDLGPETGLYGNLPELDSLTVVKLVVALRKRFGIEIKIDEIGGDIFDTLGRLAAFVESKVRWEPLEAADTRSACPASGGATRSSSPTQRAHRAEPCYEHHRRDGPRVAGLGRKGGKRWA